MIFKLLSVHRNLSGAKKKKEKSFKFEEQHVQKLVVLPAIESNRRETVGRGCLIISQYEFILQITALWKSLFLKMILHMLSPTLPYNLSHNSTKHIPWKPLPAELTRGIDRIFFLEQWDCRCLRKELGAKFWKWNEEIKQILHSQKDRYKYRGNLDRGENIVPWDQQ